VLGISQQRFSYLRKDNTISKPGKDGKYEPKDVVQDFLKYKLNSSSANELEQERIRLTRAQADKVEMDNEQARGDTIRTDLAAKYLEAVIMASRARLLVMPTKLAPIVTPCDTLRESQEVLKQGIDECLSELPQASQAALTDLLRNSSLETSTPAEDKRVGRPEQKVKPGKQRRTRAVAN